MKKNIKYKLQPFSVSTAWRKRGCSTQPITIKKQTNKDTVYIISHSIFETKSIMEKKQHYHTIHVRSPISIQLTSDGINGENRAMASLQLHH